MTTFESLRIEDRGAARIITIDRPKVLNALDEAVLGELSRAIAEVANVPQIRGLVVTGGEKAFVAGADIASMVGMEREDALTFAGKGHEVGELLEQLPKPTIAAVRGFALGGGCELALACDFIYAGRSARFGQPEVRLGVIPGFGGTQRLLRRVGVPRTLELCMTGQVLDAEAALRIGLVQRVSDDDAVVDEAVATIETIAKMAPLAIGKLKEVVYAGADVGLAEANLLERRAFAELFETSDRREGMAAFLAKRTAKFEGR